MPPALPGFVPPGRSPVGHSNMPDLALSGIHPRSQLYGDTINPWDAGRTPGGSSGGDAAALATGMVDLALGNDAGGSVRIPAAFCGVAALKPSLGRFAADHRIGGQEPTLSSQLFPVDGPMARSVGELRAAYEVLAGADVRDPRAVPVPLYGPPSVEPVRVGVSSTPAASASTPMSAQRSLPPLMRSPTGISCGRRSAHPAAEVRGALRRSVAGVDSSIDPNSPAHRGDL